MVEYGLEPDNYTGTDAPELIDAGTYTVYYRITAPNYKPYTGSAIITITQKEIQVVTADQETTYLEEAPKFTVDSVKGMVGEETLENQNAVLSFVTAYTKGYDVGEYAVQAVVDGLKNYKVEVVPGTLKVQRRTPVFTDSANLYEARVYDGKAVDLTPTTDGDGTVSRVITNRETNEVLTSDLVDVGEYRAVYSVSEGKNYTEESVSNDFAITQAPLTITAEDKSVTMGDVAPEYTVIYDGFVNGEDDSVLAGTLNFICDYEPKKIEQEYVIIPSGLTGNNYAITWVNGTLKATRRYSNLSDNDFDDRKKENITTDSQRGQVSDTRGVLTGSIITKSDLAKGGTPNDGLIHWVNDNGRYQLLYKDGIYAKAAADGKGAGAGTSGNDAVGTAHERVPVNGNWWAFGEDSYAATGWIRDSAYGSWFYLDPQTGMKRGWIFVNGKWYYLNEKADGKGGMMLANCLTPDGYYVKEDGSWDGTERK